MKLKKYGYSLLQDIKTRLSATFKVRKNWVVHHAISKRCLSGLKSE